MKTRSAISLIFALLALWISSAPTARADWLAGGNPQSIPDGQPVWRLADTNGAVINKFANLTLYHQEWVAMTLGRNGNVYVSLESDINGNQLQSFTPSGNDAGAFVIGPYINGNLITPGSLTSGPDGNLYIVDTYSAAILRYSGTNGTFLGTFVNNTRANNLTFGPDGNLYVADANLGVVRYNGINGAFMDTFVPLGTNGVPDAANLLFGPDGNLYVCSGISNAVIRFDGRTGQFMDYFVPPGSGGLNSPHWPVFGRDGNFYVGGGGGVIFRYDGQTGAFLGTFGSRADWGLVYLPDTNPPVATVTSPANSATVSGTINVSATATDNGAVTAVQLQLDGTNFSPMIASTPYATTWDTTTVTDGAHRLTAVAWDAAGNQGTSAPVTVTVQNSPVPDSIPPAATWTTPADSATVSGSITVSADATDDVGIARVQFQLDGENLGWKMTNAPFALAWNTATVSNGAHVLTAVARDLAGNQTISPITVTVTNSDPGQILLVSDTSGNILKFAADGSQSVFASGTNIFYGLAFDRAGNLFASAYNAGIIYKFTPAGAQSAFNSSSNACQVYSLAFDGAGNLFADCANVIYKFTPDGSRSSFATTATYATVPSAETFDRAGYLYITAWTFDTPNGGPQDIVLKFAPDGSSRTFETLSGYLGFYGMAFDTAGNLVLTGAGGTAVDFNGNRYEANRNDGNIYKFTPNGTPSLYVTGLNGPIGLALAPNVTTPNVRDSVQSPPPLTLQTGTNNTVQISWPSAAGNSWTLCCQQNLAGANTWVVVTNSPALVGTNYVVADYRTATGCFYRLEQR